MKKPTKVLIIISILIIMTALFSTTIFASPFITENEVRKKIAETSKESVSGNVFIWFLCAVAFLKISQKIDSFMSSLGINVGHTGGNMLAEAAIAMRGLGEGKRIFGNGSLGRKRGGSYSGTVSAANFLSGGLARAVNRQFNKSAVKSAVNQGGNIAAKNIFQNSMAKGGTFANSVISTIANGNIANTGSITGDTASQAMLSYMGYAGKNNISVKSSIKSGINKTPFYSNVEIGGGRITGTEINAENQNSIRFGMYNTEQYMPPEHGNYDVVKTADGSKWYRQYAADTVEKTPYRTKEGTIGYKENIIQKVPPMPKRKDRV